MGLFRRHDNQLFRSCYVNLHVDFESREPSLAHSFELYTNVMRSVANIIVKDSHFLLLLLLMYHSISIVNVLMTMKMLMSKKSCSFVRDRDVALNYVVILRE